MRAKRLVVQFQPRRLPGSERTLVSALRTLAEREATFVSLVEGIDQVPWVNANFETSDLAGLWRRLRESLATAGLLEGTIVTCEGERGWDDYLLLHHFDHGQRLGQLK